MRSVRGASKGGSASNIAHLHNCKNALDIAGKSVRYCTIRCKNILADARIGLYGARRVCVRNVANAIPTLRHPLPSSHGARAAITRSEQY